jgi:hypothetical protein
LDRSLYWSFSGVARDPAGGAVLNLTGTVYHGAADGTMTEFDMSPTLEQLGLTEGDKSMFYSRPIEVGPSGTIYVISETTVYKAVP